MTPPKCGARRNADQARLGQRVAQIALQRCAREPQRGADQQPKHCARQADLPDDQNGRLGPPRSVPRNRACSTVPTPILAGPKLREAANAIATSRLETNQQTGVCHTRPRRIVGCKRRIGHGC